MRCGRKFAGSRVECTNMAWILVLVIVTLMSTSAYKCKQTNSPMPYNYQVYQSDDQNGRDTDYHMARQIEQNEQRQYYDPNERTEGTPQRTPERPRQRTNERSIAVNGGLQRVQEEERKRIRIEDPIPRIENGSYKIMNNRRIFYPLLNNRRENVQDQSSISDSVVFPGPISKSSQKFTLKISEECMQIGICTEVPDYPEEEISEVLSKLGDTRHRFVMEELNIEFAQRKGPAGTDIELCQSREQIIHPQAARDTEGNWQLIVNPKDKPLQGYRAALCESPNKPCSSLISFPENYTSRCSQKYVHRTMTAVDSDFNVMEKSFSLPSCCSCVLSVN